MAAIDFPASPTLNQLFVAGNGVTYKWNGTVWVAQAASGGTGDFMATLTQQAGWLGGTNVLLLFNTVLTGNSGSWYNPATGRYTPPAGRYHIFASVCSYSSSAGAMTTQAVLRKNGTQVVQSQDTTETANSYSTAYASGVFDANGADYFDVVGWCNNSPSGNGLHWFCAFPLTGLQGPTGPIGLLSGAGPPTGVSATKGTLYSNTTATTTTTRLYVNTDGGTTWATFTASA